MEEKIYDLALKLNESIRNSEVYLECVNKEKMMNESDEVIALAYKKDMVLLRYNDALKIYSDDSEEVKAIRKELSLAKYNLDIHPLVKAYSEAYSLLKQELYKVNNILFSDLKGEE